MCEKKKRGPRANYENTTGGGRELAKAIGGMSQADAAIQIGVSPAFLNHLIHGRKIPGLGLAMRIQARFGVPIDAWI